MQAVPAPGTVIASRFRVEGELGRGGMGVVLRGRDETNRAVAIKVLLPEAVESAADAVPRFVNEARAARELTSEHAVRVLEAGMLESGLPFMVMELLEGEDLATQLEQRGRFAIADACDAVIDACDALAEAHARGMVHRDVKPANLFAARGPDGRVRVKVLDFGLSKLAAQLRQVHLTSTGTALGTPHYMAPEQLKSAKGADARADVWSLGVVLYELLTGRVPFDGKSFGHLFMQIVSEPPTPITSLRPDVPPGLAEIIVRCLEKDRDKRYSDLAALVSSLARFASPSGQAAARRIADARGAPQPVRDSTPSIAKLNGTMMMANAPRSPFASAPELAPHAPPPRPLPTSQPQMTVAMSAAPTRESGKYPPSGHYAQPPAPAPAPPTAPAPPPVAAKRAPTGAVVAAIAVALVLLAAGVFIVLVRARGH